MKTLTLDSLNDLTSQARASPRRRANLNLHTELGDAVQRLAIAMEPDTYVRPHRHPQSWELLMRLRGRFAVIFFDDFATVVERQELGEAQNAIEYAAGAWHSVVSFEPGSVIFEVKQGPYVKPPAEDSASWAPAENDAAMPVALEWLRNAQVGDQFPTM